LWRITVINQKPNNLSTFALKMKFFLSFLQQKWILYYYLFIFADVKSLDH